MDLPEHHIANKCQPFFLVFCFTKVLKTFGIFLSYDVLKILPISLFLFLYSFMWALILLRGLLVI